MKLIKITLIGFAISLFHGCGILKNRIMDSKINRYEEKIQRLYADSTYTRVVSSNGLDVFLNEINRFPYLATTSIELHDSIPTNCSFVVVTTYKAPNGISKSYKYNSLYTN